MIFGINFKNITAKKLTDPKGNININNNTKIIKVEETTVPLFRSKVARIDFGFQTTYTQGRKKIGVIAMEGSVLFKGNIREILKSWNKNKKLPDKITLPVMNSILRKCLLRAIELADQISLPPPTKMPIIQPKRPPENIEYIG